MPVRMAEGKPVAFWMAAGVIAGLTTVAVRASCARPTARTQPAKAPRAANPVYRPKPNIRQPVEFQIVAALAKNVKSIYGESESKLKLSKSANVDDLPIRMVMSTRRRFWLRPPARAGA